MTDLDRMRVSKALDHLAVARQAADFGEAAQRVYLRVLGRVEPELVIRACEALAGAPREAYGPLMPTAGDIRDRAGALRRQVAIERESQRLLAARAFDADNPPVAPEKIAQLKADVAQLVARRRMT